MQARNAFHSLARRYLYVTRHISRPRKPLQTFAHNPMNAWTAKLRNEIDTMARRSKFPYCYRWSLLALIQFQGCLRWKDDFSG